MGQVLRIDPVNPEPSALERVVRVIRSGGVIVYPTDTIYGLGCVADQPAAVERVLRIKQREGEKGLLLLVPGSESAGSLCSEVPPSFEPLAREFWPGPVTFLLPAHLDLSNLIAGDRGLVGIRNPDSRYLHLLMEAIPGPLVSTSANISGEPPSGRVGELKEQLADKVDLFVDGGDVEKVVPSTVVDLSVIPPCVVRAGVLGTEVRHAIERLQSGRRQGR
ncbi:MAG: L-threonylcarbamoyladenylate synthase [Acidobacteriota bacterium]